MQVECAWRSPHLSVRARQGKRCAAQTKVSLTAQLSGWRETGKLETKGGPWRRKNRPAVPAVREAVCAPLETVKRLLENLGSARSAQRCIEGHESVKENFVIPELRVLCSCCMACFSRTFSCKTEEQERRPASASQHAAVVTVHNIRVQEEPPSPLANPFTFFLPPGSTSRKAKQHSRRPDSRHDNNDFQAGSSMRKCWRVS